MKLSIVIPVHDQAPRLRLTLAGLERQHGNVAGQLEVLVVDDDSSDDVAGVVAEAADRAAFPLCRLTCRSRGARGVPRNLGIEHASGDRVLFLDADALPGRELVTRHLAASDPLAIGDTFVLPATEPLVDPAVLLPVDRVRAGIPDDELLAQASKGIYPGQAAWHGQLEQAVAHGEQRIAPLAVIPHNLSLDRAALGHLGGFDPEMPHLEGWELGLRAATAGLRIGFVPGARSFHLYHARSATAMSSNLDRALATLTSRFPDLAVDVFHLWIPAASGDPTIPPELGLDDWRGVARTLGDPAARAECERLTRLHRSLHRVPEALDCRFGAALNPTFG